MCTPMRWGPAVSSDSDSNNDKNYSVDISGLSEPLKALVIGVMRGITGLASPMQIRRVAKAERDAAVDRAYGDAAAMTIKERARRRMDEELAAMNLDTTPEAKEPAVPDEALEANPKAQAQGWGSRDETAITIRERSAFRAESEALAHQQNLEAVAIRGLEILMQNPPDGGLSALPDSQWLSRFRDGCRHIFDADIQELWARALAGKISSSGSFSLRTLQIVEVIDSNVADAFTRFLRACSRIDGEPAMLDMTFYWDAADISWREIECLLDVGLVTEGHDETEDIVVDELGSLSNAAATVLEIDGRRIHAIRVGPNNHQLPLFNLTRSGGEIMSLVDKATASLGKSVDVDQMLLAMDRHDPKSIKSVVKSEGMYMWLEELTSP